MLYFIGCAICAGLAGGVLNYAFESRSLDIEKKSVAIGIAVSSLMGAIALFFLTIFSAVGLV